MAATIRTAYATTRRNGRTSYRCRAFVRSELGDHSRVVGIGDTAEEATTEAVEHIRRMFAREGRADTFQTFARQDIGRVSGALLDALLF